jgi:hypothetical protein
MTPVSDSELTFSIPSDNDSDSGRSGRGQLSHRPSLGSLYHGTIGSERKKSQESMSSMSDREEILKPLPRPSALAVLSSAVEKRKVVA